MLCISLWEVKHSMITKNEFIQSMTAEVLHGKTTDFFTLFFVKRTNENSYCLFRDL